jgi:response regulator NasT
MERFAHSPLLLVARSDAALRTIRAVVGSTAKVSLAKPEPAEVAQAVAADPPLLSVVALDHARPALPDIMHALARRRQPFLVLGTEISPAEARDSARAGAVGFLPSSASIEQARASILLALHLVHSVDELHAPGDGPSASTEDYRMIDRATGVLMIQRSLSSRRAFELLRGSARQSRRRVIDVARSLIEAADAFYSTLDTDDVKH